MAELRAQPFSISSKNKTNTVQYSGYNKNVYCLTRIDDRLVKKMKATQQIGTKTVSHFIEKSCLSLPLGFSRSESAQNAKEIR